MAPTSRKENAEVGVSPQSNDPTIQSMIFNAFDIGSMHQCPNVAINAQTINHRCIKFCTR
jgi:hypothetical protein